MRTMIHHIEMYSIEKLFGKNYMTFLNATENDLHSWLEIALFAINRFPEASSILYIARKSEKFSKFATLLSYADGCSAVPTGLPAMQHDVAMQHDTLRR